MIVINGLAKQVTNKINRPVYSETTIDRTMIEYLIEYDSIKNFKKSSCKLTHKDEMAELIQTKIEPRKKSK